VKDIKQLLGELPCVRCGSKAVKVQMELGAETSAKFRCDNCGHELTADAAHNIARRWLTTLKVMDRLLGTPRKTRSGRCVVLVAEFLSEHPRGATTPASLDAVEPKIDVSDMPYGSARQLAATAFSQMKHRGLVERVAGDKYRLTGKGKKARQQ
jgi:DNA-directed RNA polymerase subunit RPC12/RpoP